MVHRRRRRCLRIFSDVPKEMLICTGGVTSVLLGGGLIFGFSPMAQALVSLPGSPFDQSSQGLKNVSSVFEIGHNITAWACIISGLVLERLGPRFCAVSGLLIEAVGHFGMVNAARLPPIATVIAYGLIGLGGCQVFLAALSFADAFKNAAFASAVLTGAFQAGGFVFMLLPQIPQYWEEFFEAYVVICLAAALLLAAVYPDEPLPSYTERVNCLTDNGVSGPAALATTMSTKRSLRSILAQRGTIGFLLTFMIAGSAYTYGAGVFPVAISAEAGCTWNGKSYEEPCTHKQLSDILQNIWVPLVSNFIVPVSLTLGYLIDRRGFALPAFINIFFVQLFILLLWWLPIELQFLTLIAQNVANTAVFTIQNSYICSIGHHHIGTLFAVSNFVIGLGNLVPDVLATNPFGSGMHAVEDSLMISSIFWLVVCTPLYFWVIIEHRRWSRTKEGIETRTHSFRSDVGSSFRSILPTFSRETSKESTGPLLEEGRELKPRREIIDGYPVYTVNPHLWDSKVQHLRRAGASRAFLVLDFDRTITKCFRRDGTKSLDSHDILASIPKVTEECKQEIENMMEYYYPIEIDPVMTAEDKIPYMVEWYKKVNALLASQNMTRDDVVEAVSNCRRFDLREGIEEVFQIASDKGIPIVIVSAGLGNIIEEVVLQRIWKPLGLIGHPWTKIHVLSNTLQWDERGNHTQFSEPLIHMYNKSLVDAPQGLKDLILGRDVGILCGDGIGDLTMADGHDTSVVLKFGFLNENPKERAPKYIGPSCFDQVVFKDGTYEPVLQVLRQIP